jgi:hypothetical protein
LILYIFKRVFFIFFTADETLNHFLRRNRRPCSSQIVKTRPGKHFIKAIYLAFH